MTLTAKQIKGVQQLTEDREDPVAFAARCIFKQFRTLERTWSYHTAQRLQQFAAMHSGTYEPPAYQDILGFLKALDELGLGAYRVGRKGLKTRIVWNDDISLKEIAMAARTFPEEIDDGMREGGFDVPLSGVDGLTGSGTSTSGTPVIRRQYQLRPNFMFSYDVPADITPGEARSLAAVVGAASTE